MLLRFAIFFFISSGALAQDSNLVTRSYHPDGSIDEIKTITGEGSYESQRFYGNGILKEFSTYENGQLKGPAKKYNTSGALSSSIFYYNADHYSFVNYGPHGEKKSSGERKNDRLFGFYEFYSIKTGKLLARDDYNKGKSVDVRRYYKKRRYRRKIPCWQHMKKRKRVTLSVDGRHKRHLKRNALAYIRFKGDDSLYRHCMVSGFTGDSLVISKFSYADAAGFHTLKYDTVMVRALADIHEIFFLKNNMDATGWLVEDLIGYGGGAVICAAILWPLEFGAELYSEPLTYLVAGAGLVTFLYGNVLSNIQSVRSYNQINFRGGSNITPRPVKP